MRVRKTTVWKELALLHQMEKNQRKLANGVVLIRTQSIVFENDQAHSLIAVFVSRAIF